MKKPLFEIGEEVILQSKTFPEYNAEYVVEEVIEKDQPVRCRLTGDRIYSSDGYSYRFSIPLLHKHYTDGTECLMDESALRKKHKPSELSFQELVSSLNTPIKA